MQTSPFFFFFFFTWKISVRNERTTESEQEEEWGGKKWMKRNEIENKEENEMKLSLNLLVYIRT